MHHKEISNFTQVHVATHKICKIMRYMQACVIYINVCVSNLHVCVYYTLTENLKCVMALKCKFHNVVTQEKYSNKPRKL